jgi:nucleotide-binding universal stress UspA family protein
MPGATGPTIVAVAAEDDRFDHVWRTAVERARERRARLILYDVDAKPSPLENPLPTNWSAHGEKEQYASKEEHGEPLTVSDLEAVGHAPLADRVREASAAGLDAFGWLPDAADAESLREFATREGAELVVVPGGTEFEQELGLPTEAVSPPPDRS